MASGSNAPFSGEFTDLENVPTLGLTDDQRQSLNDLFQATANNQFESNLAQLNYDGGFFTIYRNLNKIKSKTNVNIETLAGGIKGQSVLALKGNFDLQSVTFNDLLDVSANTSSPQDIELSNSGKKLFISDSSKIRQYNLSESFDVSTASFNQSFDTTAQTDTNNGVAFSDDGLKMFITGSTDENIYQYNLTKSFDISTASFDGQFSVTNNVGLPQGLELAKDGTKLYVVEFGGKLVEYDLSTKNDVTTATFNSTLNVAGRDDEIFDVKLNTDGSKLFVLGRQNENVYQYNLSPEYDVSSSSFQKKFDLSAQSGGNSKGLTFDSNGANLFVTFEGKLEIAQYSISTSFPSSGSIELISKDLSKSENGGFSSPPSSAVLSQSADIPTNTDIQYVLRDGNGNTVTITQSDIDTEVDTSNLTSTIIELDINLSQSSPTDAKSPTSKDVMVHFKE